LRNCSRISAALMAEIYPPSPAFAIDNRP
jgi:hypothetical protein